MDELSNLIAITVQKLDRQVSRLIDADCYDDDTVDRAKVSCNIHHLQTILDILNERTLTNNELQEINYALFLYEEGDIDLNSLLSLNLDSLLGTDVTVPLTCDCPDETTPVAPTASMVVSEIFYEIGSSQTIPLSIIFNQNNAGAATAFRIFRSDVTQILSAQSGNDVITIPSSGVSYKGEVDYAEGPANDPNSIPFVPGPISAGTLVTSSVGIKVGYPWFHGTSPTEDISALNLYTAGTKVQEDGSEEIIVNGSGTDVFYWVAVHSSIALKTHYGNPDNISNSGVIGSAGAFFSSPISRTITSNDLIANYSETYNVYVSTSPQDALLFALSNVPIDKRYIKVSKDDVTVNQVTQEINFEGAVNVFSSGNKVTVEVLSSTGPVVSSSGQISIRDEGTPLEQRPNFNFIGPGVTAVDNPATNSTDIFINSANDAASIIFTPFGNISSINVQNAIQELDTEKRNNIVVGTPISHSSSGTRVLDLNTFDIVTITINAEITELSFTNGTVGQEYIVRMVQGTTGGVLTAVANGINVLNGNAILLSTTSGDRDFLKVLVEASGTYFIEPTYDD